MSQQNTLLAFVALAVALPVVIAIGLRGRIQQRLYGDTGLFEWRERAAEMPWSERWELSRANSKGTAASPGLAPLAVERAEVMLRVNTRSLGRGTAFRRFYQGAAAFLLLVAIFNVAVALWEGDGPIWVWVYAACAALFALSAWLLFGPGRRWQEKRLHGSIEANRRLIASLCEEGNGAESGDKHS